MEGNAKSYLEKAKEAIIKLDELKKSISTLKGKSTTLEKQKENLIKEKDNKISKIIVEKRNELEKSYREVLLEAQKRLEVATKEKDKERKKNLEAKIKQNTQYLRDNNIYLQNEIKKVIKDNKLPGFVSSDFYMCLWSPMNIIQFFIGIVVLLVLVAIPTLGCFVIFKNVLTEKFGLGYIFIVVLIYAVWILFFGALWLMVDKLTKKAPTALKEIKDLKRNIQDNDKEIKVIAKKTTEEIQDKDFDYTALDREIEAGTIEVKRRQEEREEAIKNFDTVVSKEITDKINADANVVIDEIVNQIEMSKNDMDIAQKEYDDLKISISEEYDVYIGKENMTIDKLNKFISIAEADESLSIEDVLKAQA